MPKMNRKLGKLAIEEIRETIKRCATRNEISAEAARLAAHYGVCKNAIYTVTKDLRPKQKTRADKGKRIADLMEHPGLKYAASLVMGHNFDPDTAIDTAKLRGFEIPVELPTFRRYLNEKGLNRKNRRMGKTNYRRFEASAPGEVFQTDISGSKERWFDVKTRRLVQVSSLEISKNHENENKNRVKVWRFVLVDDYSRRKFIRWVPVNKPNSSHVVAFLLEAYAEMGVPKILYTDNDAIIKFGRNQRATQILDKALSDSGGYKQEECEGYKQVFHLPGNSRATGKVENAHQMVEKHEKLLGLLLAEGRVIDMDVLDRFGKQLTLKENHRVHGTTGEKPIDRWNSMRHLVRTVDAELLKSVFMVDEFEVTILGDLTFRYKGVSYQLPSDKAIENLVPLQGKKNRVRVVFPDAADFFTLIDFNENEYDILKVVATPDTFGEFKSLPEDIAETTRKELKSHAKANAKEEKERIKAGYQPKPIPIIDTVFEEPKTNALNFPKPTEDVTPRIIEAAPAPLRSVVAQGSVYTGRPLTFWEAYNKFLPEFEGKAECKEFLDSLYPSREETDWLPESEVEAAIRGNSQPQRHLKAV